MRINSIISLSMMLLIGIQIISASQDIDSCSQLNVENEVYYLTQDIVPNVFECMNITANNVTLDCQGNSMINNAFKTGNIISSYANYTTIKNCYLSGERSEESGWGSDSVGIFFGAPNVGAKIENNIIENVMRGIMFATQPPYQSNSLINNNKIENFEYGLIILGKNNSVKNNFFNSSGDLSSIFGDGNSGNIWNGNYIDGDNYFENNLIKNSYWGYSISRSGNATFRCDNLTNNHDSFLLMSDDIEYYGYGLNYDGFISAGWGSVLIEYEDNCNDLDCGWNDENCVYLESPFDCEWSGNECIYPEPIIPPIYISECQVLDQTGKTYELTKDLDNEEVINTGSGCFTFVAEGITLDCHGYHIHSESFTLSGIYSNNDNTIVKNCNIDLRKGGGAYGISFVGNNNGMILNNILIDNHIGIFLSNSNSNLIEDNTANSNNGALYIPSGGNNILKNNIFCPDPIYCTSIQTLIGTNLCNLNTGCGSSFFPCS